MFDERLPFATLYRPQLLEVIGSLGVDVGRLTTEVARIPGARVLSYPDGTLQLEGTGIAAAFESRGAGCYREYDQRVSLAENPSNPRGRFCGSFFNSLGPFPPMQYVVLHWGEFVKRWESGVHVQAGSDVPFWEIEACPIADLTVTLAFHRKLTKSIRTTLALHVAAWLAEVDEHGIFGEGKVSTLSSVIRFYDRIAQFRLDASQSGQHTVNWLILHLMNFWDAHPLRIIYFTTHPSRDISFEEEFALSGQEPIELALGRQQNRPSQ